MAVGFVAGIVFDSFFEWTFHRFVMHQRVACFDYPFTRHALVHHRVFKADETYHLQREEDKHTVPMAWWNGPALIGLTLIPFVLLAPFAGGIALVSGALLASFLYYFAYEYLHWCMHIPRKRNLERRRDFFPSQRPPSPASPLHEHQFQRGSAAGRLFVRHAPAPLQSFLRPGNRPFGPHRPTHPAMSALNWRVSKSKCSSCDAHWVITYVVSFLRKPTFRGED